MAFIRKLQGQEEALPGQELPQTGVNALPIAPGGPGFLGQATIRPASASGAVPGSQFPGIQQYLAANRQAGQTMANRALAPQEQIGKFLGGKAQREGQQINAMTQGGIAAGAQNQPGKFGQLQGYKGEGANEAKAQKVAELGALGQTEGGLGVIARQQAGAPLTSGEAALDAALLGQAAGGRFGELSKQYGGLEQRLRANKENFGFQPYVPEVGGAVAGPAKKKTQLTKEQQIALGKQRAAEAQVSAKTSQNGSRDKYGGQGKSYGPGASEAAEAERAKAREAAAAEEEAKRRKEEEEAYFRSQGA